RWREFLKTVESAASRGWKEARALLLTRDDIINADARGLDRLDAEIHWGVAAKVCELAARTSSAEPVLESCKTAADLVKTYVNDWWQIDRLHLAVRASASHSELPVFRTVADAIYFDL